MPTKIVVASCSLNQFALDFEGNLRNIKDSILQAKQLQAVYRLGPELEVCGYGCNDHFYESDTALHCMQMLDDLLNDLELYDIVIDIGMPVNNKGVLYNCRVIFHNGVILLIRPKMQLCNDANYRESRWFTSWQRSRKVDEFRLPTCLATNQKTCSFGDAVIDFNGICFGSEICEELWSPLSSHIDMGLDGVDVFTNGSGSYHELRKANARIDLVRNATAKSGGAYLFSNLFGCDGERVYYDGCSSISVNGQIVRQGKQFSLKQNEVLTAVIDIDEIRSYRNAIRSRSELASTVKSYPRVYSDFEMCSSSCANTYAKTSCPINWKYHSPEEEISLGPACWLWDYLRHSGARGFVLPLSGGLDSASTACLVYSMCQLVSVQVKEKNESVIADLSRILGRDVDAREVDARRLCRELLITCYMSTENSSSQTKALAEQLANDVGSHHLSMVISTMVGAIVLLVSTAFGILPRFKAYGGEWRENLALQNIQARCRMVIIYYLSQVLLWSAGKPGYLLVLGSSNVDESLIGYFTKYDCSSADLNPIGSISKIDLRKFIYYCRKKFDFKSLESILEAPPTAELEPLSRDGKVQQTDEADIGLTYEELSRMGRMRKPGRCGPYSMFIKMLSEYNENEMKENAKKVAQKVKKFFTSYASNRHKMATLTASYHAETYSPDDNRQDHRQLVYDVKWTWQFSCIDKEVEAIMDT